MILARLIIESFKFAFNALKTNLLRTLLSLLGVTVGIFAIISVFTLVDSMESNIQESFSFLGTGNITVEKWPYAFDGPYPWWKFLQRPHPDLEEYEFLKAKLKYAQAITIFTVRSGVTAKHNSNTSENLNLLGVGQEHPQVYDIPIKQGRFFTQQESNSGRNVAILGHRAANGLFPQQNPIGQFIKIRGLKFRVSAVIEEEGESFLGTPTNDENILVPYKSFLKLFYSEKHYGAESHITVKGLSDDPGLMQLEAELRGLMRKKRGLKPLQEDNFALNRSEMISNMIGSMFDAITVAGWLIGGFAILVGGFGIANIMFVSVRERTNIIGIQKSLGAKNYFILFQFLFEATFLSLTGGLIGILLVWLGSQIELGTFELALSLSNVLIGAGISAVVGMIFGILPAIMAARMDPVVAIRTQ